MELAAFPVRLTPENIATVAAAALAAVVDAFVRTGERTDLVVTPHQMSATNVTGRHDPDRWTLHPTVTPSQ